MWQSHRTNSITLKGARNPSASGSFCEKRWNFITSLRWRSSTWIVTRIHFRPCRTPKLISEIKFTSSPNNGELWGDLRNACLCCRLVVAYLAVEWSHVRQKNSNTAEFITQKEFHVNKLCCNVYGIWLSAAIRNLAREILLFVSAG